MPKYRMSYPYTRQFATVGRVAPGGIVEADKNPDPNFFVEAAETAKAIESRQATTTTTPRRSRTVPTPEVAVTPSATASTTTEPEEAKP